MNRWLWIPLFAATACGGNEAAVPEIPVVAFDASDFTFEGPTTIEAGMITFALTNQAETPHHLQLVRLDGMSYEDFEAHVAEIRLDRPFPEWFHGVGGVNPPPPGGEARSTLAVAPGEYAVVCLVDIPDHVPHMAKGMMRPLTVSPASGATPALPEADLSLSLVDYAFGFSAPPTSGSHVVRVTNDAQQSHEIVVVRLLPGKTVDDFGAWGATFEGPPPIETIAGVPAIEPGQAANFDLDLTPGEYIAVCFLPDATDGAPHIVHGMILPFSVS